MWRTKGQYLLVYCFSEAVLVDQSIPYQGIGDRKSKKVFASEFCCFEALLVHAYLNFILRLLGLLWMVKNDSRIVIDDEIITIRVELINELPKRTNNKGPLLNRKERRKKQKCAVQHINKKDNFLPMK